MYGIRFNSRTEQPRVLAPRADIALFVGWGVWRKGLATPAVLAQALHTRFARSVAAGAPLPLGLPLPFDSWEAFDRAAAWRERPLRAQDETADTLLGLAVRDFFANGGQRCHVLLLGAPWSLGHAPPEPEARFAELLPPFIDTERESWRGLACLRALDEVALVLLPDLPELAAQAPRRLNPAQDLPDPPEVFVECGERTAPAPRERGGLTVAAPRCGPEGYARWRSYAQRVGDFLARYRRDCQAQLALPLPSDDAGRQRDALAATQGLQSSFVQLAYPWLRPVRSPRCAEGLVAPDGALAGLVAATALGQGAYRTAAGRQPNQVFAVEPLPPVAERVTPAPGGEAQRWTSRISLFAPRQHRIELLSDRLCTDRAGWHNASAGRLMGQLLREAALIGEAFAFEPNGPALWRAVARNFERLLTAWWNDGALAGASPALAFDVRCGPAVMTPSDIDNGRLVCRVAFAPANSIERLQVDLLLREAAGVGWRDVQALPEVMV